jgi:hypothetical protein
MKRIATWLSIGIMTLGLAGTASAARVAVLSNSYFTEAATTFTALTTGHTFTGIDVSTTTPTLATLTLSYDVILLFEDGLFVNSTNVGNVVAQFANTGRPVILGTFYDQDRSDNTTYNLVGWGTLETIDPNTTDGPGTPYALRTLNAASIVAHPLTTGVTTLFSNSYGGGNQAKAGTTVLATWTQLNARALPDPTIAYRITGPACVIHIGIAPHYTSVGTFGTNFGGDFYRVWQNAFDFAGNPAGGCAAVVAAAAPVPTLGEIGLVLLVLLLAAAAWREARRRRAPAR